jgi:hypothetical protein
VRPHHEITNIRELQPGQPLRGVERGATTFYGVPSGWSGIATGYLLVGLNNTRIKSLVMGFTSYDKYHTIVHIQGLGFT